MELITAVLSFIVAIGVLVVIHEMGHFSVARLAGVKVLRFSIGFGRPLFRRVARNGTEWTIGWLPLGGYVKMLDEREAAAAGGDAAAVAAAQIDAADLPHAFNRQSLAKRFAIVAAGPVANFLLAIFLFALLHLFGSPEPAAFIGQPPATSAAAIGGLSSGEQIIGLRRPDRSDEQAIRSWPELQRALAATREQDGTVTLTGLLDGHRYAHILTFPHTVQGSDTPGEVQEDDPASTLATQLGLIPGGRPPRIVSLSPDSVAQRAGLQVGDEVVAVNQAPVSDAQALVTLMRDHPGAQMQLGIVRRAAHDGAAHDGAATPGVSTPGVAMTLALTPARVWDPASGQMIGRIGAGLATPLPMVNVRYGPLQALTLGAGKTWDVAAYSVRMFGRMLTGAASLKNLSGPVTIADYAGRSARMGLEPFISFLALVSISLGVLNLLPIPVLDGGHLLYYAVEAITGRAPSEHWQSVMQRAGLLCIVALSVLAMFNDLSRLFHG